MVNFSAMFSNITGAVSGNLPVTANVPNGKSSFTGSIVPMGQKIIDQAKQNPSDSNTITPEKIANLEKEIESQKKALGIKGEKSVDKKTNRTEIKYSDNSALIYENDKKNSVVNYTEKPDTDEAKGFEIRTAEDKENKMEYDSAFVFDKTKSSNYTLQKQGDKNSTSENVYSSVGTDVHPEGENGPSQIDVDNRNYIRNTQTTTQP